MSSAMGAGGREPAAVVLCCHRGGVAGIRLVQCMVPL